MEMKACSGGFGDSKLFLHINSVEKCSVEKPGEKNLSLSLSLEIDIEPLENASSSQQVD